MSAANAEQYLDRLNREQRRHYKAIRTARRHAWDNDELNPLDRVVMGLTGSKEVLEKYRAIAEAVASLVGEPIIGPTRIQEGANGRKILNANGGIIAGELSVSMGESYRDPSRSVQLIVPVDPIIEVKFVRGSADVTTGAGVDGDSITVGQLFNAEHGVGDDPEKDFTDHIPYPAIIGRHAIYHSQDWLNGINVMLSEIEKVSADQ